MPQTSVSALRLLLSALLMLSAPLAAHGQTASASLEPAPLLSIAEFHQTSEQWVEKPVRLRGTVTGMRHKNFFVEGPSGAVFVRNAGSKTALRVRDSIEVTGNTLTGDTQTGGATRHLLLREVRVLGPGALPAAKPVTIAEALSGKDDARLVMIRAHVAPGHTAATTGNTVPLEADGTAICAEFIAEPDGIPWPALLPGQLVETFGILSVRGPGESDPFPLRILLRSHRDITVVAPQPWWMPPWLYRFAAAALLVLAAAAAWRRLMRRQVRAQSEKIRARLERESAVEQRYRELFESATDLILTHDLAGKITSFNPAGERLLGWKAAEITGSDISVVLTRDERPDASQSTLPAPGLVGENGTVFQLDLLARDGRRIPVEISSWTEFQDGKPIGRQAICRDLTDRHRDQEERAQLDRKLQESQKFESLGILAGGVAHDFNNLLTSILGNASLAQMDSPADSPAQPCLRQIEIAAERAAGLCQQMLAYSGQGRFVVKRTDLSALVHENTEFLRATVNRKAALDLRLADDMPTTIADVTQMRQMIVNLIVNAGEAIGENPGTITVTTGAVQATREDFASSHLSPDLHEGEYVFLEVSDTGCGMDAATRAKIFDPFFTTKFTGRGLGLAAVFGIVRGHRGAIRVTSHPGIGTAFRILLPSTGSRSLQSEFTFASRPGSAGLILLVDDEEPIRTITRRMLGNFGYEVLTAADGLAAVEQVRTHGARLSAVILDLTMPRMDGAEAFQEMRLLQPGLRVLLMSGFAEQQAIVRFAGQGLTGFLQKPFKPEHLREKLSAVLTIPTSA